MQEKVEDIVIKARHPIHGMMDARYFGELWDEEKERHVFQYVGLPNELTTMGYQMKLRMERL